MAKTYRQLARDFVPILADLLRSPSMRWRIEDFLWEHKEEFLLILEAHAQVDKTPSATKWARRHPEAHRAADRAWRAANPDRVKEIARRSRRRNHKVIMYARKVGISRPEARRILTELDARRPSLLGTTDQPHER